MIDETIPIIVRRSTNYARKSSPRISRRIIMKNKPILYAILHKRYKYHRIEAYEDIRDARHDRNFRSVPSQWEVVKYVPFKKVPPNGE
jgi:hypothetical protein